MIPSLVMNLVIAVIWQSLSGAGMVGFGTGLVVGFVMLGIFPNLLGSHEYARRVLAFFRFLKIFLREFVVSNLVIAKAVLFRKREDIHPNFLTYNIDGLRPWEVFLLSQCITLTPGTTAVEISPDFQTMVIHAFDADDPAAVRESIDRNLKAAILAFSR